MPQACRVKSRCSCWTSSNAFDRSMKTTVVYYFLSRAWSQSSRVARRRSEQECEARNPNWNLQLLSSFLSEKNQRPKVRRTQFFPEPWKQLRYRPYFPRPRKYRRLFSEPTDWRRCSRGQYGEENNQAGIFEAEGKKSLIPERLARSPLNCLSTRKARNKSFVSVPSERLQVQCWFR